MPEPAKSIFGSDVESQATIDEAIGRLNDDAKALLITVEAIANRLLDRVQLMGDGWVTRIEKLMPDISINSKK